MKIIEVQYNTAWDQEWGRFRYDRYKVGEIDNVNVYIPGATMRVCEKIELVGDGIKGSEKFIKAVFNDGTLDRLQKWDKIIYADEQAYSRIFPAEEHQPDQKDS